MKSSALFSELLEAFRRQDEESYFFLLSKGLMRTTIIPKEMMIELKEKGVIPLPRKTKEFEKKMREGFVYEINDPKIAEEAFNAAMLNDAAAFERIVNDKGLKEAYANHESNFTANAMINWMVKSDISLQGQKLTPDITVSEADIKTIPDEMRSLVPVMCNNCENKEGFEVHFMKASIPCANLLMEEEVRRLMAEKGFLNFNFLGREKKDIMSASACPKCKSTDITWDFS